MGATISEVAARSGVTPATVSRIFNRGAHLYRPATRERVLAAARELNYQPNRVARSLATGSTNMIAVHVVWLHTQFYAKICNAIERELAGHGYQMMFQKLPERVTTDCEELPPPSWPVDGEIVVDGGTRFLECEVPAFSPKRPMVSIGVYCLPDVDSVQIDVYGAATRAFEHLLSKGRKRIAYIIDAPTLRGTAEPMVRAYRDAMQAAGMKQLFISPPERFPPCIEDSLREYLQKTPAAQLPDAMFCHGDIVAHVALHVLRERGLRVPEDIAIVGCGGGDETLYQRPSLTTINFPVEEMVDMSWELLARRIKQPDAVIKRVLLPAELVIRESSGG